MAGRLSQRPRHLMSSCCPGNWPAPATPPCYRPVVPTLGTLGPAPPGPAGLGPGHRDRVVDSYLLSPLGSGLGDYVWPGQSRQ